MSLGTTQALPGGDARRGISIVAAGALACALTPLLPLLSLAPWEVVTVTPYVAVILATVTLVATSGRWRSRPWRRSPCGWASSC
jgi:hypothetical protein